MSDLTAHWPSLRASRRHDGTCCQWPAGTTTCRARRKGNHAQDPCPCSGAAPPATPGGLMAGIDDPGRRSAAAWPQAVGLDLSRPGIARVHDYLLAGKDHLAPDRRLGDRLIAAGPAALRAREDRMFLGRAVRYLVTEAGVRQFLDLGAGYPVAGRGNVHEIAQALVPESRVAYIDNDPLVLAHLRALMTSAPEGQVACLPWDMRYDDLLSDLTMQRTLDYTEPIAVLLVGVLPF